MMKNKPGLDVVTFILCNRWCFHFELLHWSKKKRKENEKKGEREAETEMERKKEREKKSLESQAASLTSLTRAVPGMKEMCETTLPRASFMLSKDTHADTHAMVVLCGGVPQRYAPWKAEQRAK